MMDRRSALRLLSLHFFTLPAVWGLLAGADQDAWRQWGGPNRDFTVSAEGLAESWPEQGPPLLWKRRLGEGYSAIVVDAGILFSLYREGDNEIVVALDAVDGKTVWTYSYEAATTGMNLQHGPGPHASPLVVGSQIFTAGATGKFLALDKNNGSVLWSHDLLQDHQGTFRNRGYSSSPIAYADLVIVPVGGQGRALMAFRQRDGGIVWRSGDFDNGHASPILIDVDGQEQLVALLSAQVAGFDPETGRLLWSYPHQTNRSGLNISTPVWGEDHLLFVSSAYEGGSRVLKLSQENEKTAVDELWFSNQMRVHFGTAIRLGEYIYGSSGDFGPSILTCVRIGTGEIVWRDRSFAKASMLHRGDGKVILLDEDGNLALATLSPDGLRVHSRAQVADTLSWTVPTIVGTRIYIRNRHEIMALELAPVK